MRQYVKSILEEYWDVETVENDEVAYNALLRANSPQIDNESKHILNSSSSCMLWKQAESLFRERLYNEMQVKEWLLDKVPNEFELGAAISQGDCFFDVMAQWFNQLSWNECYNAKSLRLLCDEYAKNPTNIWLKEANKNDRENHD